jgi:hypothetical protein
MSLKGKLIIGCSALLLGLGIRSADAQSNLIVNGGFESGNFAGWTVTGNPSYSQVANFSWGYDHPNSGSDYAMLGSFGTLSYLSQSVATVAGTSYTLSFYLASDGAQTNEFLVNAGGDVLMDQVDLPSSNYTEYTYGFQATGSTTNIEFGSRDDPGYLLLDDVTLVDPPSNNGFVIDPASAVPLPAPFWMTLLPMALLGGLGWRKRQLALAAC